MSSVGAGPSSPSGVVRNSALAFVDSQQSQGAQAQVECMQQDPTREQMGQADRMPMPAGLKALCEVYSSLYPDQPNPLQVTTRLKYWLGGHDPLDYISMYWNPGKPEDNIPPHWHYVSFGISDLHGDGRVHALPNGGVSGFGAELTLRLHAADAPAPPLWPAALLQALARYMFTTGNKFCAGDHISWHAPLDARATSRVRHLMVCADPQLKETRTPHGTVAFLQIVGCTGRELRAAQRGSGFDVLKLISEDPRCGAGAWLVTRVDRRVSARGVRTAPLAGAQLAGVSAPLYWYATHEGEFQETTEAEASPPELSACVEQQIKDTLQRGLSTMSSDRTGPEGHMSTDSFEMASIERALPHIPELMQSSICEDSIEYLDGVHIIMNAEGASLLPLAIDGRVSHGRHFTWRMGSRAVTLTSPSVAGAVASRRRPRAARDQWLQLLITKELAQDMSEKVSKLAQLAETDSESDSDEETSKKDADPIVLPLTLLWPKHRIKITVVKDLELL